MRSLSSAIAVVFLVLGASSPLSAETLTPPAAPLVAVDPYFSIWSPGSQLSGTDTIHWTGKPHRLNILVKIDDQVFRLCGAEPAAIAAMPQRTQRVTPTTTEYDFANEQIEVTLSFLTPLLPYDIEVLSRPVTYVTARVKAIDGHEHRAEIMLSASAELAVNAPAQRVVCTQEKHGAINAAKVGSVEQKVLGRKGDDLRIDWGYFYLAAHESQQPELFVSDTAVSKPFTETNKPSDLKGAAPAAERFVGVVLKINQVTADSQSRWCMLAYDDLYSIQYLQQNLRPYWRRNGLDASGLLQQAAADYDKLSAACAKFDAELTADLTEIGGPEYAALACLAYRTCFAAGKFVADANGEPIQFSKENHSNGCIATSDVFYPMAPQFLFFGPTLAKSYLVPFMEYAKSSRWKFPFAPHDLGTYPLANGQVYGGGEENEENQMPVEESGNLLLLMAAVAQLEGHADFAGRYWPQLEMWAAYLKEKGYDPENQLCTDDFAGHLAHNVNLSAKAICALGAFAKLCEMRGETAEATEYRQLAQQFATRWVREAKSGDHYALTFDNPNSWSQKYNLVWDRLLGLKLFPPEVFRQEVDHYLRVQNKYGLPLDSRKDYTKLDWILWSASLTGERSDLVQLVQPVVKFLNESPDRTPLTDWYDTKTGRRVGFTARPVVGGVFMPMLLDRDRWKKWAALDVSPPRNYAPAPKTPTVIELAPTAQRVNPEWKYTTRNPGSEWFSVDFDAADWIRGAAGFGAKGGRRVRTNTPWTTREIWLRREFDLPSKLAGQVMLRWWHDEDAEVYLNGVLAAKATGHSVSYDLEAITPAAWAALKPRGNVMAVHCRHGSGGRFIDVGLVLLQHPE